LTIRSRYAAAIARGWDENTTGRDPLHEQAKTLLRRFTPSPCGFLPCAVPGDIVFRAANGNGGVVKDSAVVLTRFFF
jgi:hypothetical protein